MGSTVCKDYGIDLLQNMLDVDEIQSENTEYVAVRKAEAAYNLVGKPVIISDDAWEITALNGFPGTYAKSVNTWFTADDYIRLTKDLENREIAFTQTLVYHDAGSTKVFKSVSFGTLLPEVRGTTASSATIMKVVSMRDDGVSIAEELESGKVFSGKSTLKVWHDFAEWYSEQNS
jgi:inosine/xanthosine triphosphate pyrophosphatase family protein